MAIRIGLSIQQYEEMTPAQMKICADEYNKNRIEAQEEKKQELYLSALLISRFVWAKKPPTYEKVFKVKKKEMTDEQMFSAVVALNAALGGIDKRGEK